MNGLHGARTAPGTTGDPARSARVRGLRALSRLRRPLSTLPVPPTPTHLPPLLRGLKKASPSAQMGLIPEMGSPPPDPVRELPACVQGVTRVRVGWDR